MPEPFKELVSATTLAPVAARLGAARPGFDAGAWLEEATQGLAALALKRRVDHVCEALRRHLDPDYPSAVAHLLDALPPPSEARGFESTFAWWPATTIVERYGLADFDLSLAALRSMTRVFTGEFAIRSYLEADQDRVMERLAVWARDPCPHVRRLVSEGTRPRLPWGRRLRALVDDPRPTLPLLDLLHADPEPYVRRSVANHLGDIAKDHPDLALQTARRWLAGPSPTALQVVRHGVRHLIKQGHPDALALLGFAPPDVTDASLRLTPARLVLGQTLTVEASLRAQRPQALHLDLVVSFRGADGRLRPKVFKWTTIEVGPEPWRGSKRLPLRPVTTRRHHPGEHRVGLQVNGRIVAEASFDLTVAPPGEAAPG